MIHKNTQENRNNLPKNIGDVVHTESRSTMAISEIISIVPCRYDATIEKDVVCEIGKHKFFMVYAIDNSYDVIVQFKIQADCKNTALLIDVVGE